MDDEKRENTYFVAALQYMMEARGLDKKALKKAVAEIDPRTLDYILTGQRGVGPKSQGAFERVMGMPFIDMLNLGRLMVEENLTGDEAWERLHMPSPEILPAPSPRIASASDFVQVRKAKVKLAAGSGSLVFEDGFHGVYHFRSDWLRSKCAPADAVLFDVNGDSMEPTISDGGVVLVDRGDTEFRDGKIFAIRVGDYVRIKRLYLGMDQRIRVVSDNPDKSRFEDEFIDPVDLYIFGRAFWYAKEL